MLAWLIVNPAGTRVRTRTQVEVAKVLAREHQLSVVHTTHRGHATALTREAHDAGAELVVVMGGDGTVNEVLNGLPAASPGVPRDGRRPVPLVGLVGGGKTNVFARALGLASDPRKAAGQLVTLLRAGSIREVTLGEAGGRKFAFGAGLGLDAAIVRDVERWRSAHGVHHDDGAYVLAGLYELAGWGRSRPYLTVHLPAGRPPLRGYFAVASNGDPYSYLGPRPFRPTPRARFEGNLDLVIGQTASKRALTRALAGWLSGRSLPEFPGLPVLHDESLARLEADRPLPLQLDGEYVGDHTDVEIRALPHALRVIAPEEGPPPKRPKVAPRWGGRQDLSRVWAPDRDERDSDTASPRYS